MKRVMLVSALALSIVLVLALQSPAQSAPANATFIVNSTLDEAALSPSSSTCRSTPSNKCTLRAAIQAANAGYALAPGSQYTIVLPATDITHVSGKTYPLTIVGDREQNAGKGDLDIRSNLTIFSDSLFPSTVEAAGLNDRVFEILSTTVSVTLSHLVIQHGHIFGGEGGAIFNRGQLTLNRVSILSSTSTFSGSLTGQGGGISNYGTLFVLNSIVRGNTAATDTNLPTDSLGGGIYNYVLQPILLSNTQVVNNRVFMTNTSGFGTGLAAGGGIFNQGGVLTLTNSSVLSNTVGSSGLAVAQGGGLYHASQAGGVLIVDSRVEGNQTIANGVVGDPTTEGGGIFVLTGTLSLLRVAVARNVAGYGGGIKLQGGRLSVDDSTLYSNTATFGGGIHVFEGSLRLSGSTLSGNSALSGGGIFNHGNLTVTNSTLSANRAANDGGGLYNGARSRTVLANVTVAFNFAGSGSGDGGGLKMSSGVTLTLRNSLIAANGDFTAPFNPDCSGPLNTQGYNLIGDGTGCSGITNGANGDHVGTAAVPIDARLLPLQNNGGPTQTDALQPGSPAINAGNPLGCVDVDGNLLATDQRGVARFSRCDIGAFEFVLRTFLPLIVR